MIRSNFTENIIYIFTILILYLQFNLLRYPSLLSQVEAALASYSDEGGYFIAIVHLLLLS